MKALKEGMKGLLNRERTYGPYGIKNHDIENLYLEGIYYEPKTGRVTLSVGS
jgi:hypothetical protein